MKSSDIREKFFDFFKSKGHKIVSSAPMVIKNDPTLMFTNAGMNQFKEFFLGNTKSDSPRIANTQKCLRVSGKHNDLEEVGIDTYHHTFFEMLGNWSFGDYFKKDAINWAWELLTEVYGIDPSKIYVTIFEGDKKDNLQKDQEAYDYWRKILPENRILLGSKKDNFWEMGDQGPCGPCTEIHVDIRPDEEKKIISGSNLVNKDHPQVIELWNIVFIEYNSMANSSLVKLRVKHVDTGMGFERLCMVLQNKTSNYDTDIFKGIISEIENKTKKIYGKDVKTDRAIRVISDHVRTVCFSIADGQLPSNIGAGYVIRRILRRAIRYGYTFLELKRPFIFSLLKIISKELGRVFPEIEKQLALAEKVIKEEEISFLNTLDQGLILLDELIKNSKNNILLGDEVFQLYDTYGFPKDLTALIAREKRYSIDDLGFEKAMKAQKNRSRSASSVSFNDWNEVINIENSIFIGYDELKSQVKIVKYREVSSSKSGNYYQIILNRTPFYPEGGGQAGDKGIIITHNGERISIEDTIKENNLIIHISKKLPTEIKGELTAIVDLQIRLDSAKNHTATHLMHQALREVLGKHIEQKGSMVNSLIFRFDFSHFSKISNIELNAIEDFVNDKISKKISLVENRKVPIKKAFLSGAIGLFGEKYGDYVRTIKYGDSHELCGGIHVQNTSDIWRFKITSESSVASGVRRIEAITGTEVLKHFNHQEKVINKISSLFNQPQDIIKSLNTMIDENVNLKKELDSLNKMKLALLKKSLVEQIEVSDEIDFIIKEVDLSPKLLKDLLFEIGFRKTNLFMLLATVYDNKPYISCYISKELSEKKVLKAGEIVKKLAHLIEGAGGGQSFYASAGGKNINGVTKVIIKARDLIINWK